MQRILAAQPLHPEKVKYYLERRDPEFEAKMETLFGKMTRTYLRNIRVQSWRNCATES